MPHPLSDDAPAKSQELMRFTCAGGGDIEVQGLKQERCLCDLKFPLHSFVWEDDGDKPRKRLQHAVQHLQGFLWVGPVEFL